MRQRPQEQLNDIDYVGKLTKGQKRWLRLSLRNYYAGFEKSLRGAGVLVSKTEMIERLDSYKRDITSYGYNIERSGHRMDTEEQLIHDLIESQARDTMHYKCLKCREYLCRCPRVRQWGYSVEDYIRPVYSEDTAIRNAELTRLADSLKLAPSPRPAIRNYDVGCKVLLQPQHHLGQFRGAPVVASHLFHGRTGTVEAFCAKRQKYQVKVWHLLRYIDVFISAAELKEVVDV